MIRLSIKPLCLSLRFPLQCGQVLENTPTKRLHSVNSDFFTSKVSPLGGIVQQYNTRKGKPARLLCEVFNIPPACLKTGKTHKGVSIMRKTSPNASAQSIEQSPAIRTKAAHACKGGAL